MQELENKLQMEQSEEIERLNKEREIQKKIALQKWHAQKREDDRKKRMLERQRIRIDRSKSKNNSQSQNSKIKEDIYLQKIKATSLFKNNMELLQDFEIA
jgi:hypothetical protein